MTDRRIPIVNDFPAIAARMRELKTSVTEEVFCMGCQGRGWILITQAKVAMHVPCGICHNPNGLPEP